MLSADRHDLLIKAFFPGQDLRILLNTDPREPLSNGSESAIPDLVLHQGPQKQ